MLPGNYLWKNTNKQKCIFFDKQKNQRIKLIKKYVFFSQNTEVADI